MSKTYDIYEIAKEFDRLFPGDVNDTEIDHGQGTMAGYVGHEGNDYDQAEPSVGYFYDGGNCGHPIMSIDKEDLQRAGELLSTLEPTKYLDKIEQAFTAAGIRYQRLV